MSAEFELSVDAGRHRRAVAVVTEKRGAGSPSRRSPQAPLRAETEPPAVPEAREPLRQAGDPHPPFPGRRHRPSGPCPEPDESLGIICSAPRTPVSSDPAPISVVAVAVVLSLYSASSRSRRFPFCTDIQQPLRLFRAPARLRSRPCAHTSRAVWSAAEGGRRALCGAKWRRTGNLEFRRRSIRRPEVVAQPDRDDSNIAVGVGSPFPPTTFKCLPGLPTYP